MPTPGTLKAKTTEKGTEKRRSPDMKGDPRA
jgi:hypothetical protein